jgi:hypothetical protein
MKRLTDRQIEREQLNIINALKNIENIERRMRPHLHTATGSKYSFVVEQLALIKEAKEALQTIATKMNKRFDRITKESLNI